MARYAVLMGNGSFPNEPKLKNLRCPPLDVDGLAKVLKDEARGQFDEIIVLKNKAHYEITLELQECLNKVQKNDLILVYYSGHGIQSSSGQLHLITANTQVKALEATALGLNHLYDLIKIANCNKNLLILDCCYSGAAGKIFKGGIDSELQRINNSSRGTYLMTASTEYEIANENNDDDYSLFTKHLITGLETGEADKDGDGQITIDELYKYVHDKVLEENPNQEPTKTSKGERGEFVVAKSGHNSKAAQDEKIRRKLSDLTREDVEFIEVLTTAFKLSKLTVRQFSVEQQQHYDLLTALASDKLSPTRFIRDWDKLNQSFVPSQPVPPPKEPVIKESPKPFIQKPLPKNKPKKVVDKTPETKAKFSSLKILGMMVVLTTGGVLIVNQDWDFIKKTKKYKPIKVVTPLIDIPVVSSDTPIAIIESNMVSITGDTFQMGSPKSEVDRSSDEKLHQVKVDDFYMGKYEVSNTEYIAFLNAVKKRGTEKQPWFETKVENSGSQITGSVGNFKVEAGYENYPVVTISWYGATAYAQWLSKETGKNYRLPTEAQWEYAARAGGKEQPFSTGNCISAKQANYNGNYPYGDCSKGEYRKATVAVNSLSPNDYGLFNMHGNVWEWTCSVYDANYKGKEQQCLSNNDASNGMLPVLRGGSWNSIAQYLRSATRYRYDANVRDYGVGFRLVRM